MREDILLLLPAVILFTFLMIYPLIYTTFLSLQNFENFRRLIFEPAIKTIYINVLVFSIASVLLSMGIGLAIALCLNEQIKYRNFLRAFVTLPWGISPAVTVVLFYSWFEPRYGILNSIFSFIFGRIPWFTEYALITFILIAAWRFAPFQVLGILAALQSIPNVYYEAAQIDGANAFQRFLKITLPLISPTMVVLFLMQLMWRINHFELPQILTGGGPGYSTHLPATFAYMQIYLLNDAPYGATILFATLLIVCSICFLIIRKMRL